MTTQRPPNSGVLLWLANQKPPCKPPSSSYSLTNNHFAYTFLKVHTVQSLTPDDVLGSLFRSQPEIINTASSNPLLGIGGTDSLPSSICMLHHQTSESALAAAASSIIPAPTTIPSAANEPLAVALGSSKRGCLSSRLRDANQLTWLHFRSTMPCALMALNFRLNITNDDVIQIFCSGVVLSSLGSHSSQTQRPASAIPSVFHPDRTTAEAQKAHRSLFNRSRGLRSFNSTSIGTTIPGEVVTSRNLEMHELQEVDGGGISSKTASFHGHQQQLNRGRKQGLKETRRPNWWNVFSRGGLLRSQVTKRLDYRFKDAQRLLQRECIHTFLS